MKELNRNGLKNRNIHVGLDLVPQRKWNQTYNKLNRKCRFIYIYFYKNLSKRERYYGESKPLHNWINGYKWGVGQNSGYKYIYFSMKRDIHC